MIFRAVALAVFVCGPLWLADRGSFELRGTGSFERPQPEPKNGAGGDEISEGRSAPDVRSASGENSSSSPTASPSSSCRPCLCDSKGASPELGFVARVVYRAATSGDVELNRLVWLFVALGGATTCTCGWACRACAGDRASWTGGVAAARHRPRGAGYRAGF